jgi:type VI secretion system protein ImpE
MNPVLNAEDHLRAGDPVQALTLLQDRVRAKPGDARLRVFLFQILCVLGQWPRALTQLNVAAELDVSALAMAQMYREAIKCELLRAEVFGGRKAPMIFGQPDPWLALLIEALLRESRGDVSEGQMLRDQAFEQAPPSSGSLTTEAPQAADEVETRFEWIADADMRLGPVLEAIINGRYYWVPFARLSLIAIDSPQDLRDAVWMPAHLRFANGGESVALIPTRYSGSEANEDGLVVLARKTLWQAKATGAFCGLGQRVLTTDAGDFPLMDLRSIAMDASETEVVDANTG